MTELIYSKRQVLTFIIVLILLLAIPLSLYLVRRQQTVKSRASEFGARVEFVDEKGNVITETHNPNVKLRIILPPLSEASSSSVIVPTSSPIASSPAPASASSVPTSSPSPSSTPASSPSPSPAVSAGPVTSDSSSPSPSPSPLPSQPPVKTI